MIKVKRPGIDGVIRDDLNVLRVLAELAEQERRRQGGEIYLAVFGEVSAGKSALVRALVPGADAPSDPRAGTTTDIRRGYVAELVGEKEE